MPRAGPRPDPPDDERFMKLALGLAARAAARGEVPVGAVIVRDGVVIGRGHNLCERRRDATAHAEMVALERAMRRAGAARLPGAVVYCTLEPCIQCAGALVHARVARIVFGARDPKFGACGSLFDIPTDRRLNHRVVVEAGVGAQTSAELLRRFFRARRGRRE